MKKRFAVQGKEFLTTVRRYYNNSFTDRAKQDAMNLFLGYFEPYRHYIELNQRQEFPMGSFRQKRREVQESNEKSPSEKQVFESSDKVKLSKHLLDESEANLRVSYEDKDSKTDHSSFEFVEAEDCKENGSISTCGSVQGSVQHNRTSTVSWSALTSKFFTHRGDSENADQDKEIDSQSSSAKSDDSMDEKMGEQRPHLWEIPSDRFLHNTPAPRFVSFILFSFEFGINKEREKRRVNQVFLKNILIYKTK